MVLRIADLEASFFILLEDFLEVMVLLLESDFEINEALLLILKDVKEDVLLSILTLVNLIQHLREILDSVAWMEQVKLFDTFCSWLALKDGILLVILLAVVSELGMAPKLHSSKQ